MGSSFNPQILVEKLMKLNSSQQSIETLSHWCIFHMNKAKQVVETWAKQFHCSPREQRLAFLYLANDILQNSRRKGAEFVGEFWKVLPEALRDVMQNGDEFGRNAARRLISIWDERKVFGSRGQILKDEFVGRQPDNGNRNGKHTGSKLRQPAGNMLDRIVSDYQVVYGGHMDEDAILSKCRNTISSVERIDKEIGGEFTTGHLSGSAIVDELKGQHTVLRDCIEQLTAVQTSRANLVSHLREALQEQEFKLEQVRNQLQAAHSHSEHVDNIYGELLNSNSNVQAVTGQSRKESHTSQAPHSLISGDEERSAPVMYTRQVPFSDKSDHFKEDPKSAVAAVAAKLTASSSSAQMLTNILSSLATEGVIVSSAKESPTDYPSEKRLKLEADHSAYVPLHKPQAPVHAESVPVTSQDTTPNEQPPPPSSPPPLPPLPPAQPYPVPQYIPTVGPMPNGPYGYSPIHQQPTSFTGYPAIAPPVNGVSPFTPMNAAYSYPAEGSFYGQPSPLPMAPISRQ